MTIEMVTLSNEDGLEVTVREMGAETLVELTGGARPRHGGDPPRDPLMLELDGGINLAVDLRGLSFSVRRASAS